MTLPIKFDFTVREDRRGTSFEGIEAEHLDPEGALNLHLRLGRDHLVLNLWPVRGAMAGGGASGPGPGPAQVPRGGLRLRGLHGR